MIGQATFGQLFKANVALGQEFKAVPFGGKKDAVTAGDIRTAIARFNAGAEGDKFETAGRHGKYEKLKGPGGAVLDLPTDDGKPVVNGTLATVTAILRKAGAGEALDRVLEAAGKKKKD